jgi:hypothetical protein
MSQEAFMKSLQMIISSLIFLSALSGCASTSYQRSYVGYSATYSEPGYYDVPVESYYQPTPVIYYEQTYMPARRSHHHDDHYHERKAGRDGYGSPGRRERRENSGWRSRNNFNDVPVRGSESKWRGNDNENGKGNRQSRNQEDAIARVSRHGFYPVPRSHRGEADKASNPSEPKAGNELRRHE